MDIRCTSTGKTFYQIDSQVASLLVEALPTVFEKLEKPTMAPVPTAHWFVSSVPLSGKPVLTFQQGTETLYYDGQPEHAHTAFGKRVPPADVLERYAIAFRAFVPAPAASVPNGLTEYYRELHRKE